VVGICCNPHEPSSLPISGCRDCRRWARLSGKLIRNLSDANTLVSLVYILWIHKILHVRLWKKKSDVGQDWGFATEWWTSLYEAHFTAQARCVLSPWYILWVCVSQDHFFRTIRRKLKPLRTELAMLGPYPGLAKIGHVRLVKKGLSENM